MPELGALVRIPAEKGKANGSRRAHLHRGRKGAEGMKLWAVLHRNINKNLLRLLTAQAQAEERGEAVFPCPVCGGEARWVRKVGNGRLLCGCKKCGMYLRE